MATKLEARHLYKIFGDDPDGALGLLSEGRTKEEIFAATGNTVGVQDVSFSVDQGQIFVVMGLSGSGKSTLIRMLNGLIAPTSGEILIDGQDIATSSDEAIRAIRREKIAMVFQHFALFPHKTVADNAAYGLKVKGVAAKERRERALDALAQVGLKAQADSYPDQLSGGMQQRVGLARGLASDVEILLMDEPFGALDPLIRRDMQNELVELQHRFHKTIIFITHDLNEALILGDRIAIMKGGRFVQVGTAEAIVGAPADDYVAAFTQDIDRSRVFKAGSVAMPAEAIGQGEFSAAAAMERMDRAGRDALYVVADERPVGVVTYRDLAACARQNGGTCALETVMQGEFPAARQDASLNDLYSLAGAGLPIAVLDEASRLVGVIAPSAIFDQLTTPAAGEAVAVAR